MGDLSDRDVEDVLGGIQPPGRDDLAHVVELTTWLHVSREIEPPPAMRDDLFSQIEGGPLAYRRSSRRSPAHLGRPHRLGMRRVRGTLAGSGRPIASVAAAAVLLVGVTLAVRGGGPGHEPSAFVSRSAEGLPAAGRDAPPSPSTSTTVGSTTTSARDSMPAADPPPTTSLDGDDSSADGRATDGSTAPPDMPRDTPPVSNPPPRSLDVEPPVDEHPPGAADDGSAGAKSLDASGPSSTGAAPRSGTSDDTTQWNPPLSGWSFDLSRWSLAKEVWAALGETADSDDAVDPDADDAVDPADDDADGDDDAPGDAWGHDHNADETESPGGADPYPGGGRAG